MKPQLRLSIVVVLLSCFCTFSSRQSIAETKSPEFLYALTETDAIQNSYRVVSDIRICGYHIDRTGELRATLQTTSIFAGSLAHLQAPLIARPKLSISAFGQSQIIVLLSAVMVGGGDINRTLAYEVRRDGTLKLLFNAQSANNTRFIEVDSVDSELYAVTTADGYQPNAVIKYGVSSSGALTKKWQLAGNITQVFVSPSGQFLYCICDPGLSNISSDYGGLAIYTYRVFTDQPPIFQGRCFLPSYFRVEDIAFNPNGHTAYLKECYDHLYQFSILQNGVLRSLHPGSVSLIADYNHAATAFLPSGRRMYTAGVVDSRYSKANSELAQFKVDDQGRLSTSKSDIYSRGEVWSFAGNAAGKAFYTANGLGHAITWYKVLQDGTIKAKQSYVLKSNIVPALTVVSPSPQLNHRS